MEVHHHSHTPRQRWTHYFWEFFMLTVLQQKAARLIIFLREQYHLD